MDMYIINFSQPGTACYAIHYGALMLLIWSLKISLPINKIHSCKNAVYVQKNMCKWKEHQIWLLAENCSYYIKNVYGIIFRGCLLFTLSNILKQQRESIRNYLKIYCKFSFDQALDFNFIYTSFRSPVLCHSYELHIAID